MSTENIPEEMPELIYPNKGKKMTRMIGGVVSAREAITLNVNNAVDSATEFGYELGVMDTEQRIAEVLHDLIKRVDDGELVITDALMTLSHSIVKDEEE